MFGRKEKAALAALPPQHHALAVDRVLAVTQNSAQWRELGASLAVHDQTVHRHPLDPRVQGVIVPLLRVLGQDVAPDGPIGLRVDLRGHDAPGKVSPARPIPSHPPVIKAEESLSWDPWLVLEATLKDRSVLDLTVVDVTKIVRVEKRSASGKRKHKSKAKTTQRITAKLTLPRGRAFAPPPASPATAWLSRTAKPKGERAVVIARGKLPLNVPAGGQPPVDWQLRTLMVVVAELFRWVVPAEQAGEAPGPGGGVA